MPRTQHWAQNNGDALKLLAMLRRAAVTSRSGVALDCLKANCRWQPYREWGCRHNFTFLHLLAAECNAAGQRKPRTPRCAGLSVGLFV